MSEFGTTIDSARETVFSLADAIGRKFDDTDVATMPELTTYATWFVVNSAAATKLPFMASVHAQLMSKGSLSPAQLRAVLNIAVDLKRKRDNRAPVSVPTTILTIEDPVVTTNDSQLVVPDGIYTVVFDTATETYRTLRLRHPKPKDDGSVFGNGSQVAEYLSGSDNDHSYTGFAFVDGTDARIWRKYVGASEIVSALDILLHSNDAGQYGLAYSLKSGNCYRCNRTLTVPTSLHRGMGPDCASK